MSSASGGSADHYLTLLEAGERFERDGVDWADRLRFVAELIGARPSDAPVQAGLRARAQWPDSTPAGPRAAITTDVMAVATTAAFAAGLDDKGLAAVRDLAAALVIAGPVDASAELTIRHAGLALAAGWLALPLHRSGVVAAPGTVDEVLLTRVAP